jgi:tetratricopeptide (TPR) repeat protein
MNKPLAQTRERLHFMGMRPLINILMLICFAGTIFGGSSVSAQETEIPDQDGGALSAPLQEDDLEKKAPKGGKDLTIRSEEDRAEKLEVLFKTLKAAPSEEEAKLVAEEVWAVFLQSGSASVDFLLLRGIAAQSEGDGTLARRMYDHVIRLQPEYAEGWARSSRLAIEEDDLNRAVADITQSLMIEPRHFYALWTLGNILEKLGKQDEAFEAYEEAYKIYPLHPEIKARVEFLRDGVKGKAL